jgi:hypothetical protein
MTEINYNIETFEERKQIVEQIIEENWDQIKRHFDTYHLTKKDKIPYNFLLWQLSNYLYYCNYENQLNRNQSEFEKNVLSLNEINSNEEGIIIENNTEITEEDRKNIKEIADIQDFIDDLIKNKQKSWKRWIKDLKYNQILIKNSKTIPIPQFLTITTPTYIQEFDFEKFMIDGDDFKITSFKNPFNLDLFEEESWKTVLKVLPYRDMISDNVNKLINIFYACYPKCSFTELQESILYLYKSKNKNFFMLRNKDIAEILDVDENSVTKNIIAINKKFCDAYEILFTEYYYTFLVKGTYKTCKKCRQSKIIQDFYDNRAVCKDCFNQN